MRLLRILVASSLLAVLVAADAYAAEPVHPRLRETHATLRKKLHELADWCVAPKLFGARRDIYLLILEYWPDDEVALERTKKKKSRNLSKSGKPALMAHQARIAEWYVGAVEEAMTSAPPPERAAQRGGAIRMGVRIAPDSEKMRQLNGEVPGKVKGKRTKWILVETERSRKRRPALRKAAKKALAGVKAPKKTEPKGLDIHSAVEWVHGFEGDKGRIFGVSDAAEVKQTLANAEAMFPFFAEAFQVPMKRIRGLTLYSFDKVPNGNAFLAGQPNVTQDYLKFVHPLAALWIPKSSRVLIKSQQPDVRLEAGARQVCGAFLRSETGITAKQGWAHEGFCLHLVHHVTGTRLLATVRRSEYGEKKEEIDLAKRLRERKTDWLAEGRSLLKRDDKPDLRLLFGKTVNTLEPEDVLYGYMVAVFLIEGHADKLAALLRGFAEMDRADYDEVTGEHLGYDVRTLEARVLRWAGETFDLK